MLCLICTLCLSPLGTLEPLYSDQFPLNNKKLNIPFLLRYHLNHPANANIIPLLFEKVVEMGQSEFRLLKLLCPQVRL